METNESALTAEEQETLLEVYFGSGEYQDRLKETEKHERRLGFQKHLLEQGVYNDDIYPSDTMINPLRDEKKLNYLRRANRPPRP